jgi:hypothetical protein
MANYVIEIGLDSDVAPRYDGTYSHLISLIKVVDFAATKGDPGWFTDFKSGDQIAFRVCDYTKEIPGMPDVKVKGIFASFLNSKHPRQISPCVGDGMICSGQHYFPILEGKSLLGGDGHCWRFVDGFEGKSDKSYTLTGPGRALLRVSIAATVPIGAEGAGDVQELRWFTHDPEIIVGEGSGEPPYRRHAPRRRKG